MQDMQTRIIQAVTANFQVKRVKHVKKKTPRFYIPGQGGLMTRSKWSIYIMQRVKSIES